MSKRLAGHLCAFSCCKSATKFKEPNISFFRFPKDPERCKLWIEGCKRSDLKGKTTETLYSSYRVCSKHFKNNMFLNDLRNRLQTHAYPSDIENQAILQNRKRKASIELETPSILKRQLLRGLNEPSTYSTSTEITVEEPQICEPHSYFCTVWIKDAH